MAWTETERSHDLPALLFRRQNTFRWRHIQDQGHGTAFAITPKLRSDGFMNHRSNPLSPLLCFVLQVRRDLPTIEQVNRHQHMLKSR